MNKIIFFFLVLIQFQLLSQTEYTGLWQGILIQDGKTIDQGNIIYLNIINTKGLIEAKTKEELYGTELFAIKKLKTEIKGDILSFKQTNIEKKKISSKTNWCLFDGQLKYIDSTGYLEGKYTSSDCKRVSGKIVLYRSKNKFNDTETPIQTHIWFDQFKKDLKNGENAPEIRELERKNFIFQPVYFDYDKDEIKPEYFPFLIHLIKVVNGHTDLRIKVVGNTDSDGSDIYNEDLSRRRAQAITDFFIEHGLSQDRLKIEFNGEKKPIDNNKTPEGKQKNRRVDFEFI